MALYLSSGGASVPQLECVVEEFLAHNKQDKAAHIEIVGFCDARQDVPFKDQQITQTLVRCLEHIGQAHRITAHRFFDVKVEAEEMSNLMGKLANVAICVCVGGNTFQVAYAFHRWPGVARLIRARYESGDLMYVSFSAGSITAGQSTQIALDDTAPVTGRGAYIVNDGLKLCNYVLRPHAQTQAAKRKYANFLQDMQSGKVMDDAGNALKKCKVLQIKDGEACVFRGYDRYLLVTATSGKNEVAKWIRAVKKVPPLPRLPEFTRPPVLSKKLLGVPIRITNKASGRCLYAKVDKNWEDGFGAGPQRQVHGDGFWIITKREDSYRIVNWASNRCLFAKVDKNWEDGVGAGSEPEQVGNDGDWAISKKKGTFRIINKASNRCLFAKVDKNWEDGVGAGNEPEQVGDDGFWQFTLA